MGRLAFVEGEEAAWEDLEQIYLPAADAGDLPLRLYSFVPLTTWWVPLLGKPRHSVALRGMTAWLAFVALAAQLGWLLLSKSLLGVVARTQSHLCAQQALPSLMLTFCQAAPPQAAHG